MDKGNIQGDSTEITTTDSYKPPRTRLSDVQHGWNLLALGSLTTLIVTCCCAWRSTWVLPTWINSSYAQTIASLYTFALTLIGTIISVISVNAIRHNLSKHISRSLQSTEGLTVQEFNDFFFVYNGSKLKMITGRGLSRWWAVGFLLATLVTSSTTTLLSPRSQITYGDSSAAHNTNSTLSPCISDNQTAACNFYDVYLGDSSDFMRIIDEYNSVRSGGYYLFSLYQQNNLTITPTTLGDLVDPCYGVKHCNSNKSADTDSAFDNNEGYTVTNTSIVELGQVTRSSSNGTFATTSDGDLTYTMSNGQCSFSLSSTDNTYVVCQNDANNVTFAVLKPSNVNDDSYALLTNYTGAAQYAVEYNMNAQWFDNARIYIDLYENGGSSTMTSYVAEYSPSELLSQDISRQLTASLIKNFTSIYSAYITPASFLIENTWIKTGLSYPDGYDVNPDYATVTLEVWLAVQASSVLNAYVLTQATYSDFYYQNTQQVVGPNRRTAQGLAYIVVPFLLFIAVLSTYISAYRGRVAPFDVSNPLNLMGAFNPELALHVGEHDPKVASKIQYVQFQLAGKNIKSVV